MCRTWQKKAKICILLEYNSIKEIKNPILNYSNHLVYEANISLNWTDINKELTAKDTKWTEMTTEPSTIDTQYATKHSIKLKKYSYILSQQPYTLFRNAFFQKPDSVKNNDESNELIFTVGMKQCLSIRKRK